MKTIKEVSQIAGISVPALRYYDEIGLLKPAKLTDAGYRLYNNKSIETLQQILFFRELDIPLADIKSILEDPGYDKKQVLLKQKKLLEIKRNRLNGIIELITDVAEGVNAMSFEAFTEEDFTRIWDHFTEEDHKKMMKVLPEVGISVDNLEDMKRVTWEGLKRNEKELLKWYGSKEKVLELYFQESQQKEEPKPVVATEEPKVVGATEEPKVVGATEEPKPGGITEEPKPGGITEELEQIYRQFVRAREDDDDRLAEDAVMNLATAYKDFFKLDNARAMLLDLAEEYSWEKKLAEVNDAQYGEGLSVYMTQAIRRYYGV